MRISAIVLLMLFSHQAAHGADDPEWLKTAFKKDNPNELAYYAGTSDDSPIDDERVGDIIEGVLVRSRIKPLADAWTSAPLYLSVMVNCVKLEGNNPVYQMEIAFGKRRPIPILYDHNFGNIGIGSKDFIESILKDKVEDAITAYIKVNFDLGE